MMVAVTMTRAMARSQPPSVTHERDYNYYLCSGSFGKVSHDKYLMILRTTRSPYKVAKKNDRHLQEEEAVALLMPPSELL